MPLVRLSFTPSYDAQLQRQIADEVHAALVESIAIPADDRFQLLRQSGEMIYDRSYLGVERTDRFIAIEVVLRRGRTVDLKRTLYRRIVERLESLNVRRSDVLIVLVENGPEDWSFGDGVAQYAPA